MQLGARRRGESRLVDAAVGGQPQGAEDHPCRRRPTLGVVKFFSVAPGTTFFSTWAEGVLHHTNGLALQ